MRRLSPATALTIVLSFAAGFFIHFLYLRWSPSESSSEVPRTGRQMPPLDAPDAGLKTFPLVFAPLTPPEQPNDSELPLLQARDVEKIRALAGKRARIRGRIFRVGHSAKSNTYFLNFGPSRSALTAVIFASALEVFEKGKVSPKQFAGKDVEIRGEIKDHPQYGLEVVLESPSQIQQIN